MKYALPPGLDQRKRFDRLEGTLKIGAAHSPHAPHGSHTVPAQK